MDYVGIAAMLARYQPAEWPGACFPAGLENSTLSRRPAGVSGRSTGLRQRR